MFRVAIVKNREGIEIANINNLGKKDQLLEVMEFDTFLFDEYGQALKRIEFWKTMYEVMEEE